MFNKNTTLKTCLLIAIVFLFAIEAFCQVPTRLQVLFTKDSAKAQETAKRLDDLGFGPAVVRESEVGIKVLTRAYDSYAEANYYKKKLKDSGFSDAFAIQEKVTEKPVYGEIKSVTKSTALGQMRSDYEVKKEPTPRPKMTQVLRNLNNETAGEAELFQKCQAFTSLNDADEVIKTLEVFIRRFPNSEKLVKVKLLRAYWLLEKKYDISAREQFEAVALEHPDQKEAGEAHLRCAYLMFRDKEPEPEILKRFLKVARMEVPAEYDVRLEAMIRCAALYYRMRDLDTAEGAYKAIGDFCRDPETEAFAMMQRAGVLLEKALDKKVPYSASREICDDLLKRFPKAELHTRSTAALIAIESLCREEKYKEAVARSKSYFDKYQSTPEAPLAFYWLAKAYYETGNLKMAGELLENSILRGKQSQERFSKKDILEPAKRLASEVYEKMGNKKRAKSVLEE